MNRFRMFSTRMTKCKLSALAQMLVQQLPVVAEDGSSEVLCLAHFSEDDGITEFEPRPGWPTWTTYFPTDEEGVRKITSEQGVHNYRCVYLARVCIGEGNSVAPTRKPKSGGEEVALAIAIGREQFIRIDLHFDEKERVFRQRAALSSRVDDAS
ncbi:hypothetical protein [Stenotrophomonas sp. Iso1]|uniref:hypothetical protein n=1 Tax=Stenotrophomonas sp. Iso1 TaxID=2977283 RepID=UPI0022B78C4B|nr:hypothetical protein [Stenotrophomonas sp. Iso1]